MDETENNMVDLIEEAIEVCKKYAPKNGKPYYGCFSGGKDSVLLRHIATLAKVPVVWYYNVTTIDPPELIKFIRTHYPDTIRVRPQFGPLLHRAAKSKGIPTRTYRWCCDEYKKHNSPKDEILLLGIRAEESPSRKKRFQHLECIKENFVVSPLLNIDSKDLWNYIKGNNIPYCSLYDEGFKRLGCIGCPMTDRKTKRKEFERWPVYEKMWKKALKLNWERKSGSIQRNNKKWFGDEFFKSWEEMWDWWVNCKTLPHSTEIPTDEYETISINKISAILNLSPMTIRNIIKSGRIELDNHNRVNSKALQNFIRESSILK